MAKKIQSYNIQELPPIMKRLIQFQPVDGVPYLNNYSDFFNKEETLYGAEEYVNNPKGFNFTNNQYLADVRELLRTDPFFIVHIAMGNPFANDAKGFINKMCAHALSDLYAHYNGLNSLYLDVWAREHYKSSIKTRAIPLIHIFNNPTDTVLIQAANVKLATTLLNPVKSVLEMSEVTAAYADILWQDLKDAKKWTETELMINTGNARGENTFEISGLLEGQKIGRHYNMILSDDVETLDLARNPDQLDKLKEAYYYGLSMMASKTFINVVGTYYSHLGLLVELRDKKWNDTKGYMYNYRRVPYRDKKGELVLFSEEKARIVEQDRASCRTQYELDPTPKMDAEFTSDDLTEIHPHDIPNNLFKVIIIDPAGNKTRNGDDWAIGALGFRPDEKNHEEIDIFILDMMLMPLSEVQAIKEIAKMYGNNGLIQAVCYEHLSQGGYFGRDIIGAIKLEHRVELIEDFTLIKLFPQTRGNKKIHIKRTLAKPFNRKKIYISTAVPYHFRRRFAVEIDTFPVGRDDGLDMVSYYPLALEKLNFEYKRSAYFNKNVINLRDRGDQLPDHELAWLAR
jgi:hypothetical protein